MTLWVVFLARLVRQDGAQTHSRTCSRSPGSLPAHTTLRRSSPRWLPQNQKSMRDLPNTDYKQSQNAAQLTANMEASHHHWVSAVSRRELWGSACCSYPHELLTKGDSLSCACRKNILLGPFMYNFRKLCANLHVRAALIYPRRTRALVALEKGWVGKECLRLRQVSPEVMNFVQSSESLVSSKYLLINWEKFSFYCVMASVVRPQRQRAGGPTFPETGDLFWLKQHRMWWRNYLRESTNSDSKHTARALPVSSSAVSVPALVCELKEIWRSYRFCLLVLKAAWTKGICSIQFQVFFPLKAFL